MAWPLAPVGTTVLLPIGSNVVTTFAWYAHPKHLNDRPWWIAALVGGGPALFEYRLHVPANRIGDTQRSLAQLKIVHEVIMRSVFVPFAVVAMSEPLRLDYLWAALCVPGAVYVILRGA